MKPRLLIVDDDASLLASLVERLGARGFEVTTATAGDDALDRLRGGADVVLLDLELPRGDGLWVLQQMEAEGLVATVIVLTAHGTVERAVEAMKAGAYDFLLKPFEPERLEETLQRAAERSLLLRANRALRASEASLEFVSAAPAMQAVLATARKAAPTDSTVLLSGESGTGKEVLAQTLHAASPRGDGPFVAVNCAALAESLLEAELFGHEKGAFTGADARREGKLEAAHGGTLFLDEIGDTSAAFQTRLLRVLQERVFERVGGVRPVSVDLRVIAATNRDLPALVENGSFRADLYYRLNVIAITIPPLRERPEDVRVLAGHFAETLGADLGRPGFAIAPAALRQLEHYSWPGNVRELRNVVERALVLCEGDAIDVVDLPPEVLASEGAADDPPPGFHARVEAFRREILAESLQAHGGNQTRAAEALGLQRTYLARLIRKYELREGS